MKRFLAIVLVGIVLLSAGISCVRESSMVVACYAIPADTIEVGQEIQFTNCSVSAESYLWDFGDSTTSEEVNPIHLFEANKHFTVKLKAYRNLNIDSIYTTIVVLAAPTGIE